MYTSRQTEPAHASAAPSNALLHFTTNRSMTAATDPQNDPKLAPPVRAYRPEIDSLRALAVLAVIVNHFHHDAMPSGYLGVDVFFVISGFVITSSLIGARDRGLGDLLLWFYTRRIKRLVPALVVCVLVTATVACLFDPKPVASLRTGAASLFGLSNVYLYKQAADYFGTWIQLNAFTHTWSLGVEEQFYLLFPTVFGLAIAGSPTLRSTTRFLVVMGIFSAASLALFAHWYETNQPAAYFLAPARFWELGAGCILSVYMHRNPQIDGICRSVPPLALVAALVAALFLPADLPVLSTIVVVGLTTLLIGRFAGHLPPPRAFTHPVLVHVGRISYSLYLWHWSVLAISHWTIGVHWWSAPFQLLLMFALAQASFLYIEDPLRRAPWSAHRRNSIIYGLAASGAACAVLVVLLSTSTRALYTGGHRDTEADHAGHAEVTPGLAERDNAKAETLGHLVLIGDSHAGHFASAVQSLAGELNLFPVVVSNGASPYPTLDFSTPVGGITFERNQKGNRELNNAAQAAFDEMPPNVPSLVILSSYYVFYFDSPAGSRKYQTLTHYDQRGEMITPAAALEAWLNSLETFAKDHSEVAIVVVLSTPEMAGIYPQALCHREWFRPEPSAKCTVSVSREETVRRLIRLNEKISAKVANMPNVRIFDPFASLCPDTNPICRSHEGDTRLYTDEDHLTQAGALKVIRDLGTFIQRSDFPGMRRP